MLFYRLLWYASVVLACRIIIIQVVDWSRGQHLRPVARSLAVKASGIKDIIDVIECLGLLNSAVICFVHD